MARADALQFPPRGQYYTSADGAKTGLDAGIIYVITDTVLASYTNSQDPSNRCVGVTLPAGTVLNGDITAFNVTSGLIYHGRQ